jgi:hypothetical protein
MEKLYPPGWLVPVFRKPHENPLKPLLVLVWFFKTGAALRKTGKTYCMDSGRFQKSELLIF